MSEGVQIHVDLLLVLIAEVTNSDMLDPTIAISSVISSCRLDSFVLRSVISPNLLVGYFVGLHISAKC